MNFVQDLRDWVPLERFGRYRFGASICEYRKDLKELPNESDELWVAYAELDRDDVRIYTEDSRIVCVGSYEEFWFKGKNIIGVNIQEFLHDSGLSYDLMETQEVIDDLKTIYRFDSVSLVAWCQGDRIENLQCGEAIAD